MPPEATKMPPQAAGPDTKLVAPSGSEKLIAQFSKPTFSELDAAPPVETPAVTPTPPETPAAETPTPTPTPDPSAPSPAAEAAVKPVEPAAPPAIPDLDSFKLSPQAKPTTAAQFDGLKAAAKAREAALTAELNKLKAELEQAKQSGSQIPEEVQRELAELRAHRDATAVEQDPVFEAKWGKTVNTSAERIFNTLKSHGAADETLTEIRKVAAEAGGLNFVDWDPIIAAFPAARYSIMAALGEYESAMTDRKRAAEEAKQNRDKWSSTRAEALQQLLEGDLAKHEEELVQRLNGMPVLQSKDPALKTVIDTVRSKATNALRGASKAELAAGMGLAFYWKSVADAAVAKVSAAEQNVPAELAAAKKQVADLTAQVAAAEKELTRYRGATPKPRVSGGPAAAPKASFVAQTRAPVSALLDQHLSNSN